MFVPQGHDTYKVYEQRNAIYKDVSIGNYYISENKYEELKGFAIAPADIIVSCAGTIGESFVLPHNCPRGIINQALMRIRLYCHEISNFYLLYFDSILKKEALAAGKGSAIKNIPPFDVLKRMFIAIPPLSEQMRIVDQLKQFFRMIDTIDADASVLDNALSLTKQKILDLAIRGKLVPQAPNDEPASALLKKIKIEKEALVKSGKIKRDKHESFIFRGDDNRYYEQIDGKAADIRIEK